MARLNPQGLARRDRGLMECIIPDDGYTTVSIDLSAGEPTVTGHFSQDQNYLYATYHGVGKRPFWQHGILMIDDIYLMVMSVSPIGANAVKQAWSQQWPAGSFADQWVVDAEIIKKALGEQRKIHKILALGLGYGMGAQKMCKQMYDQGFNLELKTAKAFHRMYWQLFAGVRTFADRLSMRVEQKGYIVNPFGYRLTPDKHKAFNYFIQSSVSGVMHVFGAKLFTPAPWIIFDTCIHDEFVIQVPTARLEEAKKIKDLATASLNEDLNWSVKIRTGWAPGSSWYEAK
jgi:DNA polymerase I-like protein with 3'-5' exonuclease and polymerase domains